MRKRSKHSSKRKRLASPVGDLLERVRQENVSAARRETSNESGQTITNGAFRVDVLESTIRGDEELQRQRSSTSTSLRYLWTACGQLPMEIARACVES